jgi:hypothetical protein
MEGLEMIDPDNDYDINIDDLDSDSLFEIYDAPIAEFFDDPEAIDINDYA